MCVVILPAGMAVVVCDKASRAESLLETAGEMPSLKVVVVIEDITPSMASLAQEKALELVHFQDMLVCITIDI